MEKSTSRLKVLAILVAFMFAALTTRLWFLQVLTSASAGARIDRQSARFVETDATRGRIYDDRHRPLVLNRISLEVRVTKDQLSSDDAEGELLRLSDVLGIPSRRSARASTTRTTTTTSRSRSRTTSTRTSASTSPSTRTSSPVSRWFRRRCAITPTARWRRTSSAGSGRSTREEIKDKKFKNYGPNDLVGKTGLEQQYERFLRGTQGSAEVPGELQPGRSSRSARRAAGRSRATTWSCRSTSTRSASPSRRLSDGIDGHPRDLRRLAVPAGLPRRRTPARSS